MPTNPSPAAVFGPGFTANTTNKTITFQYANHTVPNAAFNLGEIIDGDVNATTGDARTIIYALLERVSDWSAGLNTVDRPANFLVTSFGTLTTAAGTTYISRNYNIECRTQAGNLFLIDEV
jgi:hypothetical protein